MEDIIENLMKILLALIFCFSVLVLGVLIYAGCTGQLKDEVIECPCGCEDCKCKEIKNKDTTIIIPMPMNVPFPIIVR